MTSAILFALLITFAVVWNVDAGSDSRLHLHVDDREVYTRAGFFDYRYFYRGGIPKLTQSKTEDYTCLQDCTPTNNCTLPGTKPITGSYCIRWSVTENSNGYSGSGTCKCTSRGSKYCAAYTCDQSVTQRTQVCDEYCFVSTNTFGKVKSCQCDQITNDNRPYCSAWTCLGYGDGAVKTAEWSCYTPISEMDGSSGTYSKDFCWGFGSDQTSSDVAEVKDCQCTSASNDGQYCALWLCYGRQANNWIWWSSILASPLAAALNLWVPFVFPNVESGGQVFLMVWTLLTYLLIVLLGGLPSVIANTSVLAIAFAIVYRQKLCSRAFVTSSSRDPVTGVSVCPTCGGPWKDAAAGTVA